MVATFEAAAPPARPTRPFAPERSEAPPRPQSAAPLRIGIMVRHFEQHGGVAVYTQRLLRAMLQIESPHTFVLFFRNPKSIGAFAEFGNVKEVALASRSIIYWDQIAVPRAAEAHRIDVLFNPKYSIPLSVRCPTAWVCHGLDWYVMPEAQRWMDRLSHRFLVPRYATRTDALIAVSRVTREHILEYLDVPPERIHTIYPGIDPAFRTSWSTAALDEVRQRLRLPPRYVLYSGAVYPPKNFTRLVRAYARVGPALGIPLVIAGGENRYLSKRELGEPERLGIGRWVQRLGWVDHANLPAIYALADVLLLPSLFESVGLPILEAMAAGCPVLTSNRYGCAEIAGGAAALVDPESVDSIALCLARLLEDEQYRANLSQAGRLRAEQFEWQRTASQVLGVLESIARPRDETMLVECRPGTGTCPPP